MRSSFRFLVKYLLLTGVVSLSTHLTQNDGTALISEGHDEQESMQASQRNGVSKTVSRLLSQLRGSDNKEQLFRFDVSGSTLTQISQSTNDASDVDAVSQVTVLLRKMSRTRLLAIGFLIVLTMISLFIVCSPETTDTTPQAAPGQTAASQPQPPEELAKMKMCEGTWAQTYQAAAEWEKQGLELLFRCNIIPAVEFAHSQVVQEHISESVYIAWNMLRKRPLEEWMKMCPEAQSEFQKSVTACHAARTDVYASISDRTRGTGASRDSQSPRGYQIVESQADDPSLRSYPSYGQSRILPPTAAGALSRQPQSSGGSAPAQVVIQNGTSSPTGSADFPIDRRVLGSQQERGKLLQSCRQIMAASDVKKKPWDSNATPPVSMQNLPGGASTSAPAAKASPPATSFASTASQGQNSSGKVQLLNP